MNRMRNAECGMRNEKTSRRRRRHIPRLVALHSAFTIPHSAFKRWLTFNAVGLIGFALQIGLLVVFNKLFGLHYLLATILAVGITVGHNFVWHELWTWRERRTAGARGLIRRWAAFNLSNGAVSMIGNLFLMRLFVGFLGIPLVVSNLASVCVCSLLNFVLSDRVVFVRGM